MPSCPIAVPSVIGAASVSAHGQAMISTAVATLALAPRRATRQSRRRPRAPMRADREPAAESRRQVRQPVRLRLLKTGLFHSARELTVRHIALDAKPHAWPTTRPPARTVSPRSTATGVCSPVMNA